MAQAYDAQGGSLIKRELEFWKAEYETTPMHKALGPKVDSLGKGLSELGKKIQGRLAKPKETPAAAPAAAPPPAKTKAKPKAKPKELV